MNVFLVVFANQQETRANASQFTGQGNSKSPIHRYFGIELPAAKQTRANARTVGTRAVFIYDISSHYALNFVLYNFLSIQGVAEVLTEIILRCFNGPALAELDTWCYSFDWLRWYRSFPRLTGYAKWAHQLKDVYNQHPPGIIHISLRCLVHMHDRFLP